jgi:hypothetical protein
MSNQHALPLPISCLMPAYLSLHKRRNLIYSTSSQLLHQVHQLEQVLIAKETSAAGHGDKGIWGHHRGPACWNRAQTPISVVEVNSILTPVMAIGDQLELLTSQRMVRMRYLEVGIG